MITIVRFDIRVDNIRNVKKLRRSYKRIGERIPKIDQIEAMKRKERKYVS